MHIPQKEIYLLSVDSPLLAFGIKLISNLLSNSDDDVGFIGPQAQDREIGSQWPCCLVSSRKKSSIYRINDRHTDCNFEGSVYWPRNITSKPKIASLVVLDLDMQS
jgi:hypothetical protein